jgi:hypothetical protein
MQKQKSELHKKLKHGDQKVIAEITGHSYSYVKQVISGERRSAKIIKAAESLIETRNKLIAG